MRAYARPAQVLAIALLLPLTAAGAAAIPIAWDGGGGLDTRWSVAANWATDTLPGINDTATFDVSSPTTVTIDASVGVLGININGFTGTITQGALATVRLGSAGYVQNSGTFTGLGGRMAVAGPFSQTGGAFSHAGTVVLDNNAAQPLTVTAGTTSFGDLVVNDGLIGYWKFDEPTGPTSFDSSGYGHDGAWVGSPTASADAPAVNFTDAGSARFDGATADNDYISVPRTPVLEPPVGPGGGAVSVACWMKREGNATEGRWAAVFRKSHNFNQPPYHGSYALQLPATGVGNGGAYSTIMWGTGHSTGAPTIDDLQSTVGSIPDGIWVHVAGVYDPSGPAPQKRLYINGVLNASISRTDPIIYDTNSPAGDLQMAHSGAAAPGMEYYNGWLDELRVYNRALTHQEIQTLSIGNQPGIGSIATPSRTLGGGTLDVNGSFVLNGGGFSAGGQAVQVSGSWLNHGGVFVPGVGTVFLNGAGSSLLQTGGQPFGDLRVDGPGAWTLNDRLWAGGTLTIAGGTLDVSARSHAIHAGLVNQTGGAFVPRAGSVVLDGTGGGTFRFASPPNNLRIEDTNEGGLVGYWKFDEGQRTTVSDESGLGNNGSLFNGTGLPSLPIVPSWSNTVAPTGFDNSQSIVLDGVDDYVDLGVTGMPAANAAQSISVWFRYDALPTVGEHHLVCLGVDPGSAVVMGFRDTSGTMRLEVWGWAAAYLIAPLMPAADEWHHIGYTFDGTNHRLYVDGFQVNSSTVAPNSAVPNFLNLGRWPGVGGVGYFAGALDDFRIYSTTLTPAQMTNLAGGRYAEGRNLTAMFSSGNPLTVNGTLTIDSGIFNANTQPTTLAMPFTLMPGNGEYQAGSGLQTFDGVGTPLTITGSQFTASAGTVLVNGPMLVDGGTFTGLGAAGLLDVNGSLSVSSGVFIGGAGAIDVDGAFALSGGAFTATSANMLVSGDFTVSGTPTFSAPAGTITLDGTAGAALTTGNVAFNNLTISKTGGAPGNVVTLSGNLNITGSAGADLTAATGVLDLGAGNLVVRDAITVSGTLIQRSGDITSGTGAFTIAAGGRWENRDVGDVFVGSGGVVNNGLIYLDGGGGGCTPGAPILIRATGAPTQSVWTVGLGAIFRFYDVDVQYQSATAPLTVFDGLESNNTNWSNNATCPIYAVAVSPLSGPTTEGGGTATFTLVLTLQPIADVSVTLTSLNTAEGMVTTAQPVTFTPVNWATPRTVTVQGLDDSVDDGDIPYTINTAPAVSSDPDYDGRDPENRIVTNLDDDTAGVVVSPPFGLLTSEGGLADSFTIVLATQPVSPVTIVLGSSDSTEGSVAPPSLVFTSGNWNSPQTVTVTGINDLIVDGNIPFTVITAPPTGGDAMYVAINPADVRVTNVDNDAPGITVSPLSGLWTTEGGGATSFRVVLNQAPAAGTTVVIPVLSSDSSEGVALPASLTFTPADFGIPQSVGVTGQDDPDTSNQAYTILLDPALSLDANYSGFDASDVSILNLDNDAAGISIIPVGGLTTTERRGSDVFFAVLNTAPVGGNVTFTLASSNSSEGTAVPGTLLFTPANGLTAQTVVVTGADDAAVDGDIGYTIVSSGATGPPGYGGLDPADVPVTNFDNDGAAITVSPVNGLYTSESGGTATFTVFLAQAPTSDVVVSLASGNTAEGTISTTSLFFAQANWFLSQFVTVTGVNDGVLDGTVAFQVLTLPAVSGDPAYSGINPSDVTVANVDDEVIPELDREWGNCGGSCAGAPPITGWGIALLIATLFLACRRK